MERDNFMKKLNIQDTFNTVLPADPKSENTRRQVFESCFSFVTPKMPADPTLLHVSEETLRVIGLDQIDSKSDDFLKVFSGAKILKGTDPYSMCYGGHQFGNWAGQLGDGRAINLAEVVHQNKRWALQLKGAGETPYSRSADGLAVLRSSIREHLCSEAMYHLGVPTTRSLSLMSSGNNVLRDVMYDGNPSYEKGAIVCRVAPSFIRFGNFQILAARKDVKTLKQLTDYTIKYFFSNIEMDIKEGYIQFYKEVSEKTLEMVIHWQRVGFVHGVMNTDNMSILGLTIDYGPYGWLEGYDHAWTPNTTDNGQRRYRYGYQPHIALWNLAQLANAMLLLIEDPKPLEAIIEKYKIDYHLKYVEMMKSKLGLTEENETDKGLISELEDLLQMTETDMTIFFRSLAKINKVKMKGEGKEFLDPLLKAFYEPEKINYELTDSWRSWLNKYIDRLGQESTSNEERKTKMDKVNPKYVLRNYMAQLAIDKADNGDYSLIDDLYQMLKTPYDEQPKNEKWFTKRPEWARNKVGCSMLSCSS
tara:strand:- start:1542 stop:3137 length:1596 start_codon:yes stop_codon:yes gene_type:complete